MIKAGILLIIAFTMISCNETQGIDIAKLVFEVISYIFSTVIGAIGGAKIQKVAIIKDPTNNYDGKKNKEV